MKIIISIPIGVSGMVVLSPRLGWVWLSCSASNLMNSTIAKFWILNGSTELADSSHSTVWCRREFMLSGYADITQSFS